ncbi:MAG: hypothetical protein ACLPZJ_10085 [Terriglobales bacterium]
MKERGWIEPSSLEPIVERVVGQVLDANAAQLRSEIVRRVMDEIAAEAASLEATTAGSESAKHLATSQSSPEDLARAVAEIQSGSSQREILRALLDASARYASRVALFVVKGSHATGWQARGFANNDGVKDFALDESAPAVLRAVGDRVVASVPVADLDSRFLEQFGTPTSAEARVLPLILKDKVAALVYADSGTDADGLIEAGALDLLVLSTSAWLEVNSLRKHAQKEPSAAQADNQSGSQDAGSNDAPVGGAPAFNDPFASHAPAFAAKHAMAAAASAGESSVPVANAATVAPEMAEAQSAATEVQSAVAEMEPALAEPLPIGHVETAPTPHAEPASTLSPQLSPQDQEVHRKAQRFARLLVDEIKLYNQAKVAEGRKNKDLYDRLRDTIEKSRATYQKRYGSTVAASGNYFQHEIIRSLAEDDVSIMGANFRQ